MAAAADDSATVSTIQEGAQLNKRLQALVHHMCHGPSADTGHITVMIQLLDSGADPTARNNGGRNSLHEFALVGKWWCLMTVLEVCEEVGGVDVNTKDRAGRTPLHEVARHVRHENHETSYDLGVDGVVCLRRLIRMGADINARDRRGWTPLHYAVQMQYWPEGFQGEPKVAAFLTSLLNHGADMHAKNFKGESPLYLSAMKYGSAQYEFLMLMLDRLEGDDPAAIINHPVEEHGGKTILHWVSSYAEPEPIQALLDKGADVHAVDVENWTPLIFAVNFENWSVIRPLLSRGADPDHVVLPSGDTAMHYVADRHHVATVSRLAQAGASVTRPNIHDGYAPIDCAIRAYDDDSRPNILTNAIAVIMELKRLGGSQDSTDRNGNDPVHRFCDQPPDHPQDLTRLFLAVACDHEAHHPWTGFTPLHLATLRDCAPCVRYLIGIGVNVNRVDVHGQTALHIAARSSASFEVIDELVNARIEVNHRDCKGETAAHKAETYGDVNRHPIFNVSLKGIPERSSPKKTRNSLS